MAIWRPFLRGLKTLVKPAAADRDAADEVQDFLERSIDAHRARGLSRADARRAAQVELGSVTSVRQHLREFGWQHVVETFVADVRYGLRGLRASSGFTAMCVLTLAIGVGATTAIFSAVKPILFEPVSYPGAHRIVTVTEMNPNGSRSQGTFGMFRWLRDRSRSIETMAVMKPWQPTVTGTDVAEQLTGQRVSAEYFATLGIQPVSGRDFNADDDRPNAPNVVILSDALWRSRFNGNTAIVGADVTLDDAPYRVIGVMPRDFENVLAPEAQIWAPLQYEMSQGRAWGHHLRTIARVKPGVDISAAGRELDGLGRSGLTELRPPTYGANVSFAAAPLADAVTGGVKQTLLVILGAVTLVLVIACVNVTNLMLARGIHRRPEFALRTALGAGRLRLPRQLLTESVLVALLGGAVGLLVADLGVRALIALAPSTLPRAHAIRVDLAVFVFGLGAATLVGLIVGVIPAIQAARIDPQQELQSGSPRVSGGHRRLRGALVVVEVSLALMLLVGSGLLLRSLERLFAIPAGFDPSHVMSVQVQAAGKRYADPVEASRLFDRLRDRLRTAPGVVAAAFTSQLPLSGDRDEYGVTLPERPKEGYSSFRYAVSPEYFETMRIAIREGRSFDDRDRAGAPNAAVVSASLASELFHGAPAIGHQIHVGPTDVPPYTIVGVAADLKQLSLALPDSEAVYIPESQWGMDRTISLVARTRDDGAPLASAMRQIVADVDKDQPISRVRSMDALVAATGGDRRFALVLFEAFALTALVLAAAGIYGVLARSVEERTREIGVRSVLGASRTGIVGLVLRQGVTLTLMGVAIGLAGAALLSRTVVDLLFRVPRIDPMTYGLVAAGVVGVSMLACIVPAWRAARVDPATALRSG